MKIENQVPWLGDFPHTPLALYIRKEGDQIVEIKQLESPLQQKKADSFLKQIEEKTKIRGLTDTIKVDVMQHRLDFIKAKDLADDYNIDFDTGPGYVTQSEKQKAKQAAAAKAKEEEELHQKQAQK